MIKFTFNVWGPDADGAERRLSASPTTAEPVAWRGVHVEGDYLYYDEFPKELSDEQRRQIHLAPSASERETRLLHRAAELQTKLAAATEQVRQLRASVAELEESAALLAASPAALTDAP